MNSQPISIEKLEQNQLVVWFRGVRMAFNWADVLVLLDGWQQGWSRFYQVALLDPCDTCIRTGFQGFISSVTLREYDELGALLQDAYLAHAG